MLDESERELVGELLSQPMEFPLEFKKWLLDYLATNIPQLPLNQLLGFEATQAKVADPIETEETSSATAYGDLSTVGPTIQVDDGTYAIMFGAYIVGGSTADTCYMAPSVNGGAPSDVDACVGQNLNQFSRGVIKTLSNDNDNTVTMKYRNSAAVASTWRRRWMVLLKVEVG